MSEPETTPPSELPPDPDAAVDTQALAAVEEITAFHITRVTDDERALFWAVMLSVGLHAALSVGALIGEAVLPKVEMTFEESTGIALMRRFGYVAESEAEGSTQLPNVSPEVQIAAAEPEPEAEPPDAGLDVEEPDALDDDALDEDIAEPDVTPEAPDAGFEELAPEPTPAVEQDAALSADAAPAPTPEEVAAAEAARQARLEARRQRRERERAEREAREQAEREAAEADVAGEGSVASGPDLNLPPSERYPAGTLNPVATDVSVWGPDSSVITVILRNDRIRNNPLRPSLEAMLQGLPDWNNLADGAQINPFDEIDAMLIATSDPRFVTRTFFAAVHRVDAREILSRLQTGYPGGVTWEVQNNRILGTPAGSDPRRFLIPSRDLVVFSRQEFLEDLLRGAPRGTGLDDARAWLDDPSSWTSPADGSSDGSGDGSGAPARTSLIDTTRRMGLDEELSVREEGWVAGLREIADYGGTDRNGPAAVLTLSRFANLELPGMGNAPIPQQIHASGYLEENPRLHARFMFANQAEAEAWIAAWPGIIDANRISLGLFGFYNCMAAAEWSVDHNEAIVTIIVPRETFEGLGTWLQRLNAARHGD